MANYAFETITAAQALAFTSADSLTLPAGSSAKSTTILYLADGSLSMMIGARAVIFGAALQGVASQLVFADGSRLYIGSAQADVRDLAGTATTGAIYGGDGADTLTGGGGDWFIQGNQGNDVIGVRLDRANTVYGGQGDDDLTAGHGIPGLGPVSQFMQGNKGADTILGTASADTLLGGQDNDVITGAGGQDFINGNLGDDRILGTGRLFGEGGNDVLVAADGELNVASGGDGDDTLTGRSAADTLSGDAGNDSIDGGAGNNSLDGGAGNDALIMRSYSGANTIVGGEGNDSVHGGSGADVIFGGSGNDQLVDTGGTGNRLDTGDGDDSLFITAGTGIALCGAGNDTLDAINATTYSIDGGAGNDQIRGSQRADSIQGGDGADTIDNGGGADLLYGGAGADQFEIYTQAFPDLTAEATPHLLDWSSEDRIRFHTLRPGQRPEYEERTASDFNGALAIANERLPALVHGVMSIQVGADVVVFSGLGGSYRTAILTDRSLSDVSGDNFLF